MKQIYLKKGSNIKLVWCVHASVYQFWMICLCGCSETICMIAPAQIFLWWFHIYIRGGGKSIIWCWRKSFVCVCVSGSTRTIWHTNLVHPKSYHFFLSLKCTKYIALEFTKLDQIRFFKTSTCSQFGVLYFQVEV